MAFLAIRLAFLPALPRVCAIYRRAIRTPLRVRIRTLTVELRAFGRRWVKQRRECQCSHDADHQADDKDDNEPRTVVILALAVRFVEGLSLDRFDGAIRRHVDCRRR